MESTFDRSIDSLDAVFAFIDRFQAAYPLDASLSFGLQFVVEELFTNMVKYNASGEDGIRLRLERVGDDIVGTISDPDCDPFDPAEHARVDTSAPIEERRIGGLGIHLVRHMVDTFAYEHAGRVGTLTFTRRIGDATRGSETP